MALVLLAGIGGCKASDQNVARDQSAATTADTGAARRDSGAPAATPPKAGMSDANIVAILDGANKVDSANGAIASKKATRADVKAYAKLMMSEHHTLRAEGQQLAKQLGVEPKAPEHDPLAPYAAGETKALQSAPKAEFDRTYIDNEVSVHQAVLDFANQARVTTQTAELRALIEKAIPVIRKHLDQAQAIQKEITPAA
jgi:putative membrane protein